MTPKRGKSSKLSGKMDGPHIGISSIEDLIGNVQVQGEKIPQTRKSY
jgi:hypothetical protein